MSIKTITLEINVEQTNLILEALGQLPFVRVFELIGGIQAQAKRQIEVAAAGATTPTPTPIMGAPGAD